MLYLRQSTATTVKVGPMLSSTDASRQTGLSIAYTDVRLSKNGLSFAAKSETSSCTHNENAYYTCALNTTDTGTLGRLQLDVVKSGSLPCPMDFMVVCANWYDSMVSATDRLDVEVYTKTGFQLLGDTVGTVTTLTNKSGFTLAAAGVDAILDEPVDGTLTLRQAIMLIKAACAGKSSGGGTDTIVFRDHADSKNRITATVDANGNRTAVTANTS
jgi:hypothetical protein